MKRSSIDILPSLSLLAVAALSLPALAADYPLRPAAVGKVTIADGFWGPRVTSNATVTVPHNVDFIGQTPRMANFDRAAGIDPKPFAGNAAYDSDVFKIIEGAAYSLQTRPDPAAAETLAGLVGRIIAAQQEDGFLCTRFILQEQDSRWDEIHKSHILYSAGHLLEAGVAHHGATGKRDLLDASCRYADLIDARFGPDKSHEVPGHQEIELALVKLYRATGEQRYLDLCKFFLDQRGRRPGASEQVRIEMPRPADYNQDRIPLIEENHAVGHAVRAGYTYAAMTDVAALCGDQNYARALDRIWNDVVERKLYITGGSATGQYHDEGFGDPYSLPNDTAYCETCGTAATVLWSHRMALLQEDAQYIDVLERALYNGVLSGISLTGDRFFYTNPLASRGNDRRHGSFDPACCQSNLVRIIPQVGSMAYATDAETIYINLFVAGEATLDLENGPVHLRLETDYPNDGRVRITVTAGPDQPFTVALRIPGWARETPVPSNLYRFATPDPARPTLTVAGQPVAPDADAPGDKGYLRLTRTWKRDDVIELNLPMPIRRVLAHDKVEADRDRVALQRGPLVYCVEAIDNGGLRTDAIVLPDKAALKAERHKELLGDVVLITGEAGVAFEPEPGRPAKLRPHPIVAIPYYAWANRGEGYMDVWLPRSIPTATPLPAPTAGAVAMVSASGKQPAGQLAALNDRRAGPNSGSKSIPRFIPKEDPDGTQWIQYEWDEARELSRTSVYWAVDQPETIYWNDRIRGPLLVLPKSWQLLYKDGDAWQPVNTGSAYPLQPDAANEVLFTPIKTTAVRLKIEPSDTPCAIQEWSVH